MERHATSDRLTVDQPTRGGARNGPLTDQPTTGGRVLPSLADGLTLLDVAEGRNVAILQSLVLDHLLGHDGPAFWVDADGHATTTTLAQLAPGRRLLDRIRVARGFTASQHYSAVCSLPVAVNRSIRKSATGDGPRSRQTAGSDEGSSAHTPALVVAPAVDARYRADDALGEEAAATLQARTLARLRTYADGYDVPVLLTRTTADEFTAPVVTAADHRLECEQTRFGPRFVGDDFETLVYPVGDGAYYQTTFAYWQQLLAARAAQVGVEPTTPTTAPSTAGVGTGLTTDGETTALTASPLLDAWTGPGGR